MRREESVDVGRRRLCPHRRILSCVLKRTAAAPSVQSRALLRAAAAAAAAAACCMLLLLVVR